MASRANVNEREPAVAGLFYPRDAEECRGKVREYLDRSPGRRIARGIGGIVPHAGWIFSGAIAGLTIGMLAGGADPDVVVVFGAIHTPLPTDRAVLDDYARWRVPGGSAEVADAIRGPLSELSAFFAVDDRFHHDEHAVEVELPLIRQAWPRAMILPVEVPVLEAAAEMGERTLAAVEAAGLSAIYLASSDLTHYGPDYGFTPAGEGTAGFQWALDNDRRLLDQLPTLAPREVVAHVRQHRNACGGGAIAAMLAACRAKGPIAVQVPRHGSSHDVASRLAPRRIANTVGYAAVVVELTERTE